MAEPEGPPVPISTHTSSAPAFLAPEVLQGQSCTEKSEVFSFGIFLWELSHRRPPAMGKDRQCTITKAIRRGNNIPLSPLT